MSKTTIISLDIDTSKLAEFYFSLAMHKASSGGNVEFLKKMADAISFDYEILMTKLQLSEEKQKSRERSIMEIHAYLYNSKRDSEGYFEVSKNSVKEFTASPFGKELREKFHMMELSKQWTGKAGSTEVQVFIALYMYTSFMLAEAFKTAMTNPQKGNSTFSMVQRIGNQRIQVELRENEKGDISLTENGVEIAPTLIEYFVEKEGKVVKVKREEIDYKATLFYVKTRENVVRLKQLEKGFEVTPVFNAKTLGSSLELSYAQFGDSYNTEVESAEIKNESKPVQLDFNKVKVDNAVYLKLVREFERFLRLPKGAREQTEARDEIIIDLYHTLSEHYPKLTPHVANTITGYISSRMGLLDTQEIYDETERKQPYRKYLRDTVYNILKAHGLVKK